MDLNMTVEEFLKFVNTLLAVKCEHCTVYVNEEGHLYNRPIKMGVFHTHPKETVPSGAARTLANWINNPS